MTKQINFKFNHSTLTDSDNVSVVKFNGDEGISKLFEFTIELKSSNADLDIDAILESPASLEIGLGDDTRKIQGIVSHFDAVRQINNDTIYIATLVPRLWELSLYHTNEVYLEMTVTEIIETVLKEAGFSSLDYDVSGIEDNDVTNKVWPYKCQYGETHLDFISRLMERDGIYYYFVEGDVGEKVVFCNSLNFQEAIAIPDVLYSPVSSLEINALEDTVNSFVSQQKRLPYKVLVKDYNDDKPSVDIKGEAVIDDKANKASEIYVWGQNIETPEEGGVLAQIRAEEFLAGKRTYHGESSVVRLVTGFNFNLKDHFRQSCNQEYLLLNITHEGSNPSALDFSGGIENLAPVYGNSFSAMAADVQYRPEQLTTKPEIHGTLNAFVDSEGDGQYAEVDEEGRYRVTLPFDRVDRDGGKASHWLRMSQPFSGENQGMHFPLRKGAEVLLTFIGGDPDRPVIAGSIPNASQPSVVNADNQTNSMIKTGAGNKIELEDKDGKNRIKLETGDGKTYFHIGAPNHDGDGVVLLTSGIERKEVIGGQQTLIAAKGAEYAEGKSFSSAGSTDSLGQIIDDVVEQDAYAFPKEPLSKVNKGVFGQLDELKGERLFERRIGEKHFWSAGDEFYYGGGNVYGFGGGVTEDHAARICDSDDGDIADFAVEDKIKGTWDHEENGKSIGLSSDDIDASLVEKTWGSTISYQNGNNYAWGDGADYNFGDGYEENIMDGSDINASYEHDKAKNGGPDWGSISTESVTGFGGSTGVWVSKSIGNTYDYVKGNTLEVVNGGSESHVYGDSHDEVHGHSIEHIRGSSHSTHHGATNEMFMGACSAFMFGATSDISLAASNEMFVGLKNDMSLSAAFELKLGASLGISAGVHNEFEIVRIEGKGIGLKADGSDVEAKINEIATRVNKVQNGVNKISTGAIDIGNGAVAIRLKALTMM